VPINNQTVEAFYVLEGTLEIKLASVWMTLSTGAFVVVPTGVLRGFGNPSNQTARFMVIMSPGGFEGYFDELAVLVEKHGVPSPPTSWLNS
jgi:quercetin dioxygenase-like cupin family protein